MSVLVHVAVAIITNQQNEVLISLRHKDAHQGGLWEFPGGKVEREESVLDALKREIKEELNILIHSASPFKSIHHQYSDKAVLLDIWLVESFTGKAQGAEGQQIKWQAIKDLNTRGFPAANRVIIHALKFPEKYMITGSFNDYRDFESKLETSLKKGVSLVQLRCKDVSLEEYKLLAQLSVSLCKLYGATLLLNSSVETFLNTQADGLHLSSQMLHLIQSRPISNDLILSASCHTKLEIEKAKKLKVDIILLSPVKETRSHPGVKGIGWDKFTETIENIDEPVYALGGMVEADLDDAKLSGAQGIAAISSFWEN